jgi:2'-5' RNA ligase
VPAPELDELLDASARDPGMPAHVTVLYPFLPVAAIDTSTEQAVASVIARTPALDVTVAEVRRFPGVIYLAPEPAAPLVALTEALVERWPECRPYRGAYEEVVPHLTVAYGDSVPAGVTERLPALFRADEVWLMARACGRWMCRRRFSLGAP